MSPQLVELTRERCLELLAGHELGRVVICTPLTQTAVIRPVNYTFDAYSQSVVFRTSSGSKFYALAHSARAWFEVDYLDPVTRSGWSVIVGGMTEEITQATEVARLNGLGLESWMPGDPEHWFQIRARTVSGRAID
jgi:nitroimidazol reductase NimA-like FMN-containing flavoprotein (pyridoxamine 5'-phosphate oxidase superfamily)